MPSTVYELIRRLRPVEAVPVVRFEGVPGEFSQHDFGQVDVRYRAGGGERIRFFASRLSGAASSMWPWAPTSGRRR